MVRRLLAIAVVLGVVTTAAAAGASVRADDSAVTKDQVKVGISYVDLAPVRQLGIKRDHGDYQKAYQTVIDDINAHGGVNGRKIVPVYAAVNPIGTDPAQQACIKLTEDQKVFVAIGQFQNDAPLCYVEQHDIPVLGGTITSDYLSRAKAPWYTLEPSDPDLAQITDAFAKEGAFKKTKLGIVTHVQEKPLLDNVVMPALKKNKVSGTSAIITAPADDTVAAEQEASTIAERFKADGVKTILTVGNSIVTMSRALAKTDYRPRLVATSLAPMSSYVGNASSDLSVLPNAISGNVAYPYADPELAKCRDMVAKATGEVMVETPPQGDPQNRVSAEVACRYMALFTGLATAAGKNLTTASFAKAAQKAGSVDIPGSGKIAYLPKSHTFAQPVYIYRYDPASKTMVADPEPVGAKAASSTASK
jgi:ABC-type branched-subunit amino acid transport system substrate-binding protein